MVLVLDPVIDFLAVLLLDGVRDQRAHRRMAREGLLEIDLAQGEQHRVRHGDDARGARPAREERGLAEEVALLEHEDELLHATTS